MELTIEGLQERGFELPARVVAAELVAGREDLADRADPTCPVCGEEGGVCVGLLYLRTHEGTLGSGSHPGHLHRVHLACADWTPRAVGDATRIHHGAPICDDCLRAAGADGRRLRRASAGTKCAGCLESLAEAEAEERREAEVDAALAAEFGAPSGR